MQSLNNKKQQQTISTDQREMKKNNNRDTNANTHTHTPMSTHREVRQRTERDRYGDLFFAIFIHFNDGLIEFMCTHIHTHTHRTTRIQSHTDTPRTHDARSFICYEKETLIVKMKAAAAAITRERNSNMCVCMLHMVYSGSCAIPIGDLLLTLLHSYIDMSKKYVCVCVNC